jgi:hypothetical protein
VASKALQRFVASTPAFPKLVGREKFLKCDFFNYIKIIRNGRVKNQNKIKKG